MSPLISVIIPNLNAPAIDRTLAALTAQTSDPDQLEILVVGRDEPGLVPRNHALIRFIETERPTAPAAARNIGIRQARGRFVCFTDADCRPAPDWLTTLMASFQDPDTAVVGGGVSFDTDAYWTLCDNLGWFYLFSVLAPPGPRPLLPSLNLAVRRPVIDVVGLFDERYPLPAGEDSEWTTRMRLAGYTLHFEPKAVVHHQPSRANFAAIWRHGLNYGRYSIKIHPDYLDFLKTPPYLRHWWLVLCLAPLMALTISLNIFRQNKQARPFWRAVPGIFLGKLAWCWGVAQTLRQTKDQR